VGRSRRRRLSTTAQQRFAVLQSGEVDLLARNTTVTLTRGSASISPPSITMTVRASW
jgi:ABC-type amino acid transport substrate-binding protein